MKLKDIKVGEIVAIVKKRNGRYRPHPSGDALKGKVVKVGVRGKVRGSWHDTMSDRADYVEFEIIEDPLATSRSMAFDFRLTLDPRTGHKIGRHSSDVARAREVEVHRAPCRVVKLWADHVTACNEYDEAQVRNEEHRNEKAERNKVLWGRLIALGIKSSSDYGRTYDPSLYLSDMEAICTAMEKAGAKVERDG